MEFFNELSQLLTGTKKVTIIAQQVGDQLTVGFFPEFASKDLNEKVKMVSITGTPQEMDEGFFAEIRKPIEAASTGLKSNAEEVATEIKAAAEEELADEKAEAERKEKAASKKSAPVKKAAPTKKAEVKKPETKKPAPKKEDKKKVDPDHNEGTTAEEIIENASIEEVKPIELEEPETIIELDNETHEVTPAEVHQEYVESSEAICTTPEEPSPADKQKMIDDLLEKGEDAMNLKEYKQAQTLFEEAMELSEDNPKSYNLAYKKHSTATMWVKARERMNA